MITFTEEHIEFHDYPFSAATVYPHGRVPHDQITEVLLDRFPPEIRLPNGETLFVSAVYKEVLGEFAHKHQIPVVSRIDTWALLLEPFVDTETKEAEQEKTYRMLEESGISRAEALKIRDSVNDLMIAYNYKSMLWDWFHLGMHDLLNGYCGVLTGDAYKLSRRQFQTVYWQAMDIANKGIIRKKRIT